MTRLRIFIARIVGMLTGRRGDRMLDAEIQGHLELLAADHAARGLSADEARAAAQRDFGGVEQTKEHHREQRGWFFVDDLVRDIRYAIRAVARAPGFAVVAVVTLALGIGANTAMFTIVNSLLLRTLPIENPQRLVVLSSARAMNGGWTASWEYALWEEIRQRADVFDGALATSGYRQRFDLGDQGDDGSVDGGFVSGDFFTTLGVRPVLGRTFTSADDVRGGRAGGAVTVISYALWQQRFGGALDVIGRTLLVNRIPVRIVGVTPPGFFGTEVGRSLDVALPLTLAPLIRGDAAWLESGPSFLTIMLRLKPGQSLEGSTAMLRALQPRIFDGVWPLDPATAPRADDERNDPFVLLPAARGNSMLRLQYARPLLTIFAIAGLVLLIACANIANLMLARAIARKHEVTVRLAVGASRTRIIRQLLVESLVLAMLGAAIGLMLALWVSQALVARLSNFGSPVFLNLSLDWRVWAFTAAATVFTAALFGTLPAFRATRVAPIDALKGGDSGGRLGRRGPFGIIVAQVALSLMLVVAAGLFIRTLDRIVRVPLGFDSDRVLVVTVNASRSALAPADHVPFFRTLVEAVSAVPGVSAAAASPTTPIDFGPIMITPLDPSQNRSVPERQREIITYFVTPGWFRTYGTPMHAGRDINDLDIASSLPVVVVNDAFVRRFFPGTNPIGMAVTSVTNDTTGVGRPRIIVGVVGDAVAISPRAETMPTMYQPLAQQEWGSRAAEIQISVRSASGAAAALAPGVAAALASIDRNLSLQTRSLEDRVNASLAQERLVAVLSAFFGVLALILAAVGLYGVTAYSVTRCEAEIGVRMAIGASRASVLALVLRRGLVPAAVGIVVGLGGAALVTRYLTAMLFGVTPLDPPTFIAVGVLFAFVAIVAALMPARRAMTLDPVVALRCE